MVVALDKISLSLFLISVVGVASAQTFNVAEDFSVTQNGGANPWSYGAAPSVGGSFTSMTLQTAGPWLSQDIAGWNLDDTYDGSNTGLEYYPFIVKNYGAEISYPGNAGPGSNLTIGAGELVLHASSVNLAVIRLTTPGSAGNLYNGSFTFTRLQVHPTEVYSQSVGLLKNGVLLDSEVISGNGTSTTFNLANLSLMSGDTLDLFVQALPDASGGTIGLSGSIQAVPEPGSLALLLGGLSLFAKRKRR